MANAIAAASSAPTSDINAPCAVPNINPDAAYIGAAGTKGISDAAATADAITAGPNGPDAVATDCAAATHAGPDSAAPTPCATTSSRAARNATTAATYAHSCGVVPYERTSGCS